MSYRLSSIVTRTGDDGSTGLADGSRVQKNSPRICAIGSVDELNSHIGVLRAENLPQDIDNVLLAIQHDLFDLGASLALPVAPFSEDRLARLDRASEHYNAALSPLKEFILPGGTRAAALCHVARAVARRAERDFVALKLADTAPEYGLPYLNRLSDLLFILSRSLNAAAGQTETMWHKN